MRPDGDVIIFPQVGSGDDKNIDGNVDIRQNKFKKIVTRQWELNREDLGKRRKFLRDKLYVFTNYTLFYKKKSCSDFFEVF